MIKSSPRWLAAPLKPTFRLMSWCGLALLVGSGIAQASRRPGAPRPLRLLWPEDKAAGALLRTGADTTPPSNFDGVIAHRVTAERRSRNAVNAGEGPESWLLFFTSQSNDTRNLYQAEPQVRSGVATNGSGEGKSGEAGAESGSVWRNLAWRVTPLTHLAAPLFAEQPDVSPDGRTLLCATNALSGPAPATGHAPGSNALGSNAPLRSQIARLDLPTGRWTTLTAADAHDYSPVIAPDGRQFAFVSNRAGLESVYIMPIEGGMARRVATMGRKPCWLDAETLLFESTRPGQAGLYRLALPHEGATAVWEPRPRLFFDHMGEAALAPDGQQVCITADGTSRSPAGRSDNSLTSASQLYLLSPDGSGSRAVPETVGAHAPHFTPDGNAIVFDAPLNASATGGAAAEPRMLWLLPMLHVPPAAVLMSVRPVAGAGYVALPGAMADEVEVLGTAFAEGGGMTEVRLEYGEGAAPTRWHSIPVVPTTVQQGKLATWKLPPGAEGDWTLRLTVTDSSHDAAQTTLPISLPLAPLPQLAQGNSAPLNGVPLDATQGDAPGSTATSQSLTTDTGPGVVSPSMPSPNRTSVAISPKIGSRHPRPPRSSSRPPLNPPTRLAGPVQVLPLPALPPAPTPHPNLPRSGNGSPNSGNAPGNAPPGNAPPGSAAPNNVPLGGPTAPQNPTFPDLPSFNPPSGPLPPSHPKSKTRHSKTSNPNRKPPRTGPRPDTPSSTGVARADEGDSGDTGHKTHTVTHPAPTDESTSNGADDARITVQGTPAVMQAGENANVTATLRNIGVQSWATESGQPVRLVYRWVDATTGIRTRWAVRWLQGSVAPGGTAQLAVTLAAPPRPGRYRLTYLMVRLNGDKFEPPPATTPGARWPGEFGGITYRVTVRPAENSTGDAPTRTETKNETRTDERNSPQRSESRRSESRRKRQD